MNLKLLNRRTVFEGRVFDIIVDDVAYPSGRPTVREVARHSGGAVVLPVLGDGRVVLIRQHRYPLDQFIWELPAGKLYKGEDPLDCAKRELEEETGYLATEWTLLNSIYTTPGFCDEVLHIYLAAGLTEAPGGRKPEEGEESMTVSIVPMGEALRMVDTMEIRDGKSICGLLQGVRHLSGASKPQAADRTFRLGLDHCVRADCDGIPLEISHYERNNWVTAEMRCPKCSTRFTLKAEM
jgi:ADP-ribose pyrophosphatase